MMRTKSIGQARLKESRQNYGSRRVFRGGGSVGKGTVEHLMREHNIRGKKSRYFKQTIYSRHTMPIAEYLVERRLLTVIAAKSSALA